MLLGMKTQRDERPATVPTDTFPVRLAIARHHAGGISAREAAALVGVSGQTWRNWEDGRGLSSALRPAMLHYIAQELGVDEQWLRNGGPLTVDVRRRTGDLVETTRPAASVPPPGFEPGHSDYTRSLHWRSPRRLVKALTSDPRYKMRTIHDRPWGWGR